MIKAVKAKTTSAVESIPEEKNGCIYVTVQKSSEN
jgi:hypothetical protein